MDVLLTAPAWITSGPSAAICSAVFSPGRTMAMWPGRSVVIMVACHHELPAVGSGLRLIGIGELHPAARRAFFGEPFVLRIRQQFLAVLRRAQNVDAEILGSGGDEGAAMSMFARRRFRHAGR